MVFVYDVEDELQVCPVSDQSLSQVRCDLQIEEGGGVGYVWITQLHIKDNTSIKL